MKMYYVGIMLVALTIFGCGGPTHITRPGFSDAEYSGDTLECKTVSRRLGDKGIWWGTTMDDDWVLCMRSKGYSFITK